MDQGDQPWDQPLALDQPVFWSPPSLAPALFQNATLGIQLHKIECWVYNGAEPITESFDGVYTKEEITDWLSGPSPTLSGGVTLAGGLRLLCWEQKDSLKFPFSKATLEAVQNTLGLPKAHSYLTLPKSGACGKYLGTTGKPIFIYHRSNNNGTISTVFNYDSASNVTTGYVLSGPRILLKDLCVKIRSQFTEFTHPLLIPTVLIELTAADLMRELYHIHKLLTMSESKTGSGDWVIGDSEANENVEGSSNTVTAKSSSSPALEEGYEDEAAEKLKKQPSYWEKMSKLMDKCKDNHERARILGWLNCRFAFMNAAVKCSISMTEFTLKEMDLLKGYCVSGDNCTLDSVMNTVCLKNRIEFLASNLNHTANFAAIEPRMQAQQTLLFNLINIGMARDSKELAEASKQDSSAMKIIAVLTTLFLPGAFTATLFAMPILDWNAASMRSVMTDHFWVYWAVAIPLTVVVMVVIVIAYGLLQAQSNREAARAREEAGFEKV